MIRMPWKVISICFCIKLRIGCLIIGYFMLIFNLFILTPLSVLSVTVVKDLYGDERVTTLFTVWAALFIIHLIFNVVLLVGLHVQKCNLIRAYLIYAIIFIILIVKLTPEMRGVISYPDDISYVTPSVAEEATVSLIYLATYIYFVIVIWSYWFKMDDSRRFAF